MKKKLLLYSDCFTFGGSEYVAVNILKSNFIQSYYELHFAYRDHEEYSCYVKRLFENEGSVHIHPLKIWSNGTLFHKINLKIRNKYLRYAVKLPMWLVAQTGLYEWNNKRVFRRFLSEHKVDLVHINNGGYPASESCLYFSMCAKEMGVKNILQINNRATPARINRRDNTVGQSVDLFLTATEYAREELSTNRHFNLDRIITLFNAVDVPIPQKKKDKVCEELSISPNKFIITEVALLEKRKGQIPLLKALLNLKEINNELYEKTIIILVGNGEDEDVIVKFIKENKLEDKVKLLGYRLDYIDIVNASDVFALPSIFNEDMPLSILSAMALSKPILSSKLAGIPEEVEDGVNGYLADPQSSAFEYNLACLIEKVYNKKEILGKASFDRFNKYFRRDIYETKLLNIYKSLINSSDEADRRMP